MFGDIGWSPAPAVAAADWFEDSIAAVLEDRAACHMAVSGGRTPWEALALLATRPVAWDRVHIWQVDERVAPDGHPDRNATHLDRVLLGPAGIHPAHIHLMPVAAGDPEEAALRYADELDRLAVERLDLVHLGLGSDGHTASWAPGDPVIAVRDRAVAATGVFGGYRRVTLTVPAVNAAERRLFLVTGDDKAAALGALLARRPDIPALAVTLEGTDVIADRSLAPATPPPGRESS